LTIATPVYLGMYEAGSATVSGGVQLNGNNRSNNTANSLFYLDVPSAATLTLSGIVKHANTYATNTLVKVGAGTAVLAGANTYGCPTIISSGTLSISNNAALGTGLLTLAGGTLAASAGTWTIANNVNLASNSTVDTGANSLTLSGAITNSGGLTKTGSGTLMFSGSNTYSGATVISGGKIKFYRGPAVSGINYFKITGDADSGISSNNVYTHAIIPGGGSESVNGIPFAGAGTGTLAAGDLTHKSYSGTNGTVTINNSIGASTFGTQTIGANLGGWAGITPGGMLNVFKYFIFTGTRTVVLNGLSPNTWYDVRLYQKQWDTSVGRTFAVAYDVGNNGSVEFTSPTIDQNHPESTSALQALGIAQTNAWAMSYVFQTGGSETNISLAMGNTTYHYYGISCQMAEGLETKGMLPASTTLSITNGAILDLNSGNQTLAGLQEGGLVTNGTLTVTGTLAPGGVNTIGDLTVNANLVMAENSTYDWNFGTATQDTVNVTGTLTLPSSATVNVSRVTGSSAQQPDSAVLMTFTTGPSDGALSGWVITGARAGSYAIVRNNKVLLISSNGTLIRFM
jgi:autotransporter-associated beta strand protein